MEPVAGRYYCANRCQTILSRTLSSAIRTPGALDSTQRLRKQALRKQILRKQGFDEPAAVEHLKVIDLLAHPDVFYGYLELI